LRILKRGLGRIIQDRKLERFAYRLNDVLREIITVVNFESFRDFGTIDMDESKDLDEMFTDLSPSDQAEVKNIIKELHQVGLFPVLTDE
jgi:hypothetical protein